MLQLMVLLPLVALTMVAVVGSFVGEYFGFDLPLDLGSPEPTLADGQPYAWRSAHPFIVDLDHDGHDDVLGLIESRDGQHLWLVALSGEDWGLLWQREITVKPRPDDLRLHYEASHQRAWLIAGRSLIDFDARTGDERLERRMPDTIARLAVLGPHLWVELDDGRTQRYDLDGLNDTWGFAPDLREDQVLRDDLGFSTIVAGPARDLSGVVFADLDTIASYCLDGVAPVAAQAVTASCTARAGLAWAETADQRPVLVGYELGGEAERWRVELDSPPATGRLRPGTRVWAARIGTEDALVGFALEGSQLRLRRLSRVDGEKRWEVVVIGDAPGQVDGLQVVGDRIYLVQGGVLHVRDAGRGAVILELGPG